MSLGLTKDELRALIRQSVKEVTDETPPLQNHIDHTCGCPDCYCGLIDRMNKLSDYSCPKCGLPLGNKAFVERIDSCPNCGSTDTPRKIER